MENRTEIGEYPSGLFVKQIIKRTTPSELENKCIVCGKEKDKRSMKFCSFKCYYIYGRPELKARGGIQRICLQCKQQFKVSPSRIKGVGGHQGKFCSHKCYWESKKGISHIVSKETCDKISKAKSWDKEKCQSPIKLLIRESRKNEQWKKEVFARDGYVCQNCQEGRNLVAHHIKAFAVIVDELIAEKGIKNLYEKAMEYKPLWDINNGITLCEKCHKKIPKYSRRVETERSAPQNIEDGATVRTLQECKEISRNVLSISLN